MARGTIDAYDDGLALVLQLGAPATEADVAAARALLGEWLGAYESSGEQRYRNCGVEGEAGVRTLVLWADRIQDPDGYEAASARLREIGARASARLDVVRWRLETADEASAADLEQRLGVPPMIIRPRRTAAPSEGAPGESGDTRFGVVRGGATATLVVAVLARWLEPPLSGIVAGGVVAIGALTLTLVGRDFLSRLAIGLGAVAVVAGVACAAHPAGTLGTLLRLVALGAALAWSLAIPRRRP